LKTRSAKQKGKTLERLIAQKLLDKFPELTYNEDIRITIGQERGEDLKLSKKAQALIPLQIEAKSRSSMAIYTYMEQAKSHKAGLEPCVIVKMNRRKPLVCIDLDYFLELLYDRNRKT
jgi:hypothetical protein